MRKIVVLEESDHNAELDYLEDADVVVRKVTYYEVIKDRFGRLGVRVKSLDDLEES